MRARPEAPRQSKRTRRAAAGDPEHAPEARGSGRAQRGSAGDDQGKPGMERRPRPKALIECAGVAMPRQQQRASGGRGEEYAQRGRGADRAVKGLTVIGILGIQHDERDGLGPRDHPALVHLAASRDRRPVDAGCGAALAIRAQAVNLELNGARLANRGGSLVARAGRPGAQAGDPGRACLHRLDPGRTQSSPAWGTSIRRE